MRLPFVLSAFLLCAAAGSAQQSVQPTAAAAPPQRVFPTPAMATLLAQPHRQAAKVIALTPSCPVNVTARRSPGTTMIFTGDASHPARPVPQALLLHVDGLATEIEAIAYGPAPGAHVIPAATPSRPVFEQSESFTLAGNTQDTDGDFHLRTTRLSTVQRVRITKVRFLDGTVWTADQEHGCVVVPSGYLPV